MQISALLAMVSATIGSMIANGQSEVAEETADDLQQLTRALKAAGLHFTSHSLRHTFAALLFQRGEGPVYVQRQLGHEVPWEAAADGV